MVVAAPGVTGNPSPAVVGRERRRIGLVAEVAHGRRYNRGASGQQKPRIGAEVAGARHVTHLAVHPGVEPALEVASAVSLGGLGHTDEVESLSDGTALEVGGQSAHRWRVSQRPRLCLGREE